MRYQWGIPLKLHHLLSPGMAFSSVANGHFVQLGREILHYPKAQELGLDLPPLPSACYIGRTGVFDGCSAPVLSDENMRFGVSAPRSRSRRWARASVGDCLQIVSEVSVVSNLTGIIGRSNGKRAMMDVSFYRKAFRPAVFNKVN